MTEHRLLLIRHAQGSLGSDDYDRLSPLGHRQASCIAAGLSTPVAGAHLARGRLRRHRETAAYLHEGGGWHVDADLDEYRVDGLLAAAMDRAEPLGLTPPPAGAWQDPVAYLDTFLELFPRVLEAWQAGSIQCATNGRWPAFLARVEAAAERLALALAEHRTVVAVTSAGVISTMAASLLQRDLGWQRVLNVSMYNAAVTELVRGPEGDWQAARVNCTAHLDPGLRTLA